MWRPWENSGGPNAGQMGGQSFKSSGYDANAAYGYGGEGESWNSHQGDGGYQQPSQSHSGLIFNFSDSNNWNNSISSVTNNLGTKRSNSTVGKCQELSLSTAPLNDKRIDVDNVYYDLLDHNYAKVPETVNDFQCMNGNISDSIPNINMDLYLPIPAPYSVDSGYVPSPLSLSEESYGEAASPMPDAQLSTEMSDESNYHFDVSASILIEKNKSLIDNSNNFDTEEIIIKNDSTSSQLYTKSADPSRLENYDTLFRNLNSEQQDNLKVIQKRVNNYLAHNLSKTNTRVNLEKGMKSFYYGLQLFGKDVGANSLDALFPLLPDVIELYVDDDNMNLVDRYVIQLSYSKLLETVSHKLYLTVLLSMLNVECSKITKSGDPSLRNVFFEISLDKYIDDAPATMKNVNEKFTKMWDHPILIDDLKSPEILTVSDLIRKKDHLFGEKDGSLFCKNIEAELNRLGIKLNKHENLWVIGFDYEDIEPTENEDDGAYDYDYEYEDEEDDIIKDLFSTVLIGKPEKVVPSKVLKKSRKRSFLNLSTVKPKSPFYPVIYLTPSVVECRPVATVNCGIKSSTKESVIDPSADNCETYRQLIKNFFADVFKGLIEPLLAMDTTTEYGKCKIRQILRTFSPSWFVHHNVAQAKSREEFIVIVVICFLFVRQMFKFMRQVDFKNCMMKTSSLMEYSEPKIGKQGGTLTCPACPLTFETKLSLDTHSLTHIQSSSKSSPPPTTTTATPPIPKPEKVKKKRNRNRGKNAPAQNPNNVCFDCNRQFNTRAGLLTHRQRSHTSFLKICSIPECGHEFHSYSEMQSHMNIHKRTYVCEVCTNVFDKKSALTVHLRTHRNDKPFVCDICAKAFYQKTHLNDHLRTHSDDKPFICDICAKCFTRKSSLNVHLRTHRNDKPFVCDICAKAFYQKTHLNDHLRTHSDDKPFICDICAKCFTQKSSLNVHLRTHSNDKPFVCDICATCFTQKSSLNVHLRTHSNDKPFVCEVCSKGFKQKTNLAVHFRMHSNDS